MTEPNIFKQICIQKESEYWYTVEDTDLDVGCPGLTISAWSLDEDGNEKRDHYLCMPLDYIPALEKAIQALSPRRFK